MTRSCSPYRSTLWQGVLLGLVLCSLWLMPIASRADARSSEPITVYHYNPESHNDRNLVLKNTFDRYFGSRLNMQLQPVEDRKAFQQLVEKSKEAIFIMSDWHYHQLASANRLLVPCLRGLEDGKDTFRKLLIGNSPNLLQKKNTGITLAVSGPQGYVDTLLANMQINTNPVTLNNAKYLTVPKDIDALMAVSFGLADAALASEVSFEKLSQLNQEAYKNLQVLGRSTPQKSLVVVVNRENLLKLQPALDAIASMPQSPDGKLGLNLMGLDKWKRLPLTTEAKVRPEL